MTTKTVTIVKNSLMDENGNVDWDTAMKIFKDKNKDNESELETFKCKKCKESFTCKNYFGKYPLCHKHRFKESS